MKPAAWMIIPLLLAATASITLRGQEKSKSPGRVDGLLEQLRPGEQVMLSEATHGYRLALVSRGEQERQQVLDPSLEIQLRYARKQLEVARAELESALSANQRVASTFPEHQIQRLRLEAQRSELQLENLLNAARGNGPYEVVRSGRDYIALRLDGRESLVPLHAISVVIRPSEE